MSNATRKLTAILSADAVGFSRLMGRDEVGTHRNLQDDRRVIDALIATHNGRIVGTAGDSVLADFASVVEALRCAVAVQQALGEQNAKRALDERLEFRIGLNLGDVIVDGDTIFGDGVNVAARLQSLARPGGICISASVHEQVRNKLALRYRSRGEQRVKNIEDPVRAYDVEWGTEATPRRHRARRTGAVRRPLLWAGTVLAVLLVGLGVWQWRATRTVEAGRPAVAVLSFENQSGDAHDDYFADGITEDIIGALGRFPELSVLSKNAVAVYKGQAVAPDVLGRALGARYLVEGSVRKTAERVRVSVRLTDATRGVVLWSDNFDREAKDVFAVQDDITHGVAAALAVRLGQRERELANAKPTDNLAAYDYVLRGRSIQGRASRAKNQEARGLFERAITLDPNYAEAYAALGWTQYQAVTSGWVEFAGDALDDAERSAQKALQLDRGTVSAYTLLGAIHLARQQYDQALGELREALRLNPSDAEALAARGAILMWSGQSAEAAASLETALRLDPDTRIPAAMNLGFTYYLTRRYEAAVRTLELCLARSQQNDLARMFCQAVLAASDAQLDRTEDAARARAAVLEQSPFFNIDNFVSQLRGADDRRLMTEGLRKAGFP